MGIMQEVIKAVTDESAKAGATRVNTVTLTVGELTEIVPDSLQFAWECLTPDTSLDGAVLEILGSGGRSLCLNCGVEFDHDRFDRHCEACGSFATQVVRGNELRIEHIDVDTPDAEATG
jgi:hydrogenase nickel incorporation protein HypA/HybF